MVGYFYHLDYLHKDDAVAASAVIEVPDSPPPPPKKKAKRSAPAKRSRANTAAPKVALPPSLKVHLIEHAKVFAMAVKYHVDALRNLAVQKFQTEVGQHWDHEDLAHAVHVIYTSTADEVTQLREVTVEALNAHRDQLLEKPEIATLLRSITGLACDLSCAATPRLSPGIQAELSVTVRTGLVAALPNHLNVDSAANSSKHASVVLEIPTTMKVALMGGGDVQGVAR